MTTCLLIRHGQSQANLDGILAGHLDSTLTEEGERQARRMATSLRAAPIRRIVTSPLGRCRATAHELSVIHPDAGPAAVEEGLTEVRYGAWTGRSLRDLGREELWATIQSRPSSVVFPPHREHPEEGLAAMAERAWAAWQHWDDVVENAHGEGALWALVSHGDVIKAVLARALGLHLDAFQSIVVDPASVSIVHHRGGRTAVSGLNLREDVLARLSEAPPARDGADSADAVVGGGNG